MKMKIKIKDEEKDLTEGWIGTLLYILLGIIIAFGINKILGLALSTDMPVVAVVTTSMKHDETTDVVFYQWVEENLGLTREDIEKWPINGGFDRGDILVVKGEKLENLKVGDVIVFSVSNQRVPIVHRIVKIDGDVFITKGDHNRLEDHYSTKYEDIHGKVIFIIPKLGYFKLWFTEIFGIW